MMPKYGMDTDTPWIWQGASDMDFTHKKQRIGYNTIAYFEVSMHDRLEGLG